MVEAWLAKKRKANIDKAAAAPITELATRSTSAKGASVDTPATMFIEDVRAILRQARRGAYAAANHIMVQAYWNIGRRIVREEQGGKQRADYGQFLIRNLTRPRQIRRLTGALNCELEIVHSRSAVCRPAPRAQSCAQCSNTPAP